MELMVAIGIFSILSAIAVPGFIRFLPDYNLKSAARDLRSNFQLAKMTAIKTGVSCAVTFNQQVDGDTYDYVVFEDADNDLELDNSESTDIIRKVKWEDYKFVSGDANSFEDNDDGLPAVAFRSNGIPRDNDTIFNAGTVSIKNTRESEADIEMSMAGNVKVAVVIH